MKRRWGSSGRSLLEGILAGIATLATGYALLGYAVSGSLVVPLVLYIGIPPWIIFAIVSLWPRPKDPEEA